MARLKLHNSLTREKQDFEPIDPSHIRIYACGPTVYSYAHIGNARMAVVFDVLSNVLRTLYPKVTYVSNITDIDDKIIAASQKTGEKIDVITKKYADIYNADMKSLGVQAPDIQPRATDHIPHMIALIEELIENNHAYTADDHVLFDVPSFPAYGGLSGRNRDEQIAGARVEVASYKKDPADFVLWKPSTDNEPGWDSPWGFGRPGWHIECSAMAAEHLGLPFDIHGGGADLKFPHHENEIAQSCCAHGDEDDLSSFAKYWVHNGFVTVNGEKMSKSLGNVTLAHDLVKDHAGETLRFTLLSAHYRQPLDWTNESIAQSKKTLDRMYQNLRKIENIEIDKNAEPTSEVIDALYDDLNTPKAIAALFTLVKSAAETKSSALKSEVLAAAKILGILQNDPNEWLGYHYASAEFTGSATVEADGIITPSAAKIEGLLQQRTEARANNNYARSDEIRDDLTAMGIAIEDTAEGTLWKKI
ncbi:MAG: cysteine--tRNA ligase [Alphaproteobacteria bacterium]|nr:MAG: cysteine--tRNA ligase [Alphaproteobacteria bacterium]